MKVLLKNKRGGSKETIEDVGHLPLSKIYRDSLLDISDDPLNQERLLSQK